MPTFLTICNYFRISVCLGFFWQYQLLYFRWIVNFEDKYRIRFRANNIFFQLRKWRSYIISFLTCTVNPSQGLDPYVGHYVGQLAYITTQIIGLYRMGNCTAHISHGFYHMRQCFLIWVPAQEAPRAMVEWQNHSICVAFSAKILLKTTDHHNWHRFIIIVWSLK